MPDDHRNIPAPPDAELTLRRASSPAVHWLALATAVATFPLIFMGGLVTSHHAGMSVPDWPNSYHYNMFLFPPSHWVGGILYEHTHRLMGTVVGMLSIALVVAAWWPSKPHEKPEPHRYLALAVLGAVILQGVLGGLRVVLVKLDLAIVHACVAQAFFCLAAYAALVTSKWWADLNGGRALPATSANGGQCPPYTDRGARGLFVLGAITVTVVYVQLMVGATMRHFDAGLAIPDLPWAYGKLLPPTTAEGLASINHLRGFQLYLDPVTLTQVWFHFAHRIGALLVSALVILFAIRALMTRTLKWPAVALLLLLATQLTLGVLTVLLRKPADVASAHVAIGALVLVTGFVMTAALARIFTPGQAQRRPGSAENREQTTMEFPSPVLQNTRVQRPSVIPGCALSPNPKL